MIMTASTSWLSSALSWTTLGYSLLAFGVIATLLSPYRYLFIYMLAGMIYWLVIEGLQSGLLWLFDLSHWQGYVLALALTWLPFSIGLLYYLNKKYASIDGSTQNIYQRDTYIEHTPIYDNYTPRFHR